MDATTCSSRSNIESKRIGGNDDVDLSQATTLRETGLAIAHLISVGILSRTTMRRLARVLLSTLEKGPSSKDTDIVNLVTDGDMYKCKHCEKEAALCPSLRRVRRNSLGFVFPTLCGTCFEHSKAKSRWERLDWLKANHVRELNPNSSSSSIAPTVSPSPQVSSSASIAPAVLLRPQASSSVPAAAASVPSPRASTAASTAAAVSQSLRASSALPEPKMSAKGEVKGTPGCASLKRVSESKSESALCARKNKPVSAPPTLEGR